MNGRIQARAAASLLGVMPPGAEDVAPGEPERDPPADLKLSPSEFTRMLLEGTRRQGLHWKTIEDLFEMAMRQGMPE